MPAQKIKQLTIEQQALVSSYRKKWGSSIFSTKRITQYNVEQVVTDIYTYLEKTLPEFIERITIQIDRRFQEMGNTSPWQDIDLELDKALCHTWQGNWRDDLKNAVKEIYFYKLNTLIRPRREVGNASFMDFCTSVLGCTFNQHSWNIYQILIKECGWFFPFENVCLICDRFQ